VRCYAVPVTNSATAGLVIYIGLAVIASSVMSVVFRSFRRACWRNIGGRRAGCVLMLAAIGLGAHRRPHTSQLTESPTW
jgi:hypothetical protein